MRDFQMSLSKVRFSLFCIAFEELPAHLQAGSQHPVPQCWLYLTGAESKKEHRKPVEPHQSKNYFLSIQAVSWSNTLLNPVSSIPWELIFALQLLSQWLIVPFGDAVKCAALLQLWVVFIHWIHGLWECISELFVLIFLAKFQLVLEKLDLFKSHQCILTSRLLPVPVFLEPCSCCAAICAVPVGNRGAWTLCRHQISKSDSLQCRTSLLYWSLWHYGEGWIMDLCPKLGSVLFFPTLSWLCHLPQRGGKRKTHRKYHVLSTRTPHPQEQVGCWCPSVPLFWKLLVMWFVH